MTQTDTRALNKHAEVEQSTIRHLIPVCFFLSRRYPIPATSTISNFNTRFFFVTSRPLHSHHGQPAFFVLGSPCNSNKSTPAYRQVLEPGWSSLSTHSNINTSTLHPEESKSYHRTHGSGCIILRESESCALIWFLFFISHVSHSESICLFVSLLFVSLSRTYSPQYRALPCYYFLDGFSINYMSGLCPGWI
jgi:hypothetical protein